MPNELITGPTSPASSSHIASRTPRSTTLCMLWKLQLEIIIRTQTPFSATLLIHQKTDARIEQITLPWSHINRDVGKALYTHVHSLRTFTCIAGCKGKAYECVGHTTGHSRANSNIQSWSTNSARHSATWQSGGRLPITRYRVTHGRHTASTIRINPPLTWTGYGFHARKTIGVI